MNHSPYRIAAAMMLISLLLFSLGISAAWNVQRQQVVGSEMIAREVHGMIAAQDLYLDMREIRNHLQQFLRTNEERELASVDHLCSRSQERIDTMSRLVRTEQERVLLHGVSGGVNEFVTKYSTERSHEHDSQAAFRKAIEHLIDDVLSPQILRPAREFVEQNRQVVDRANETNRHTTDQTRQAFLLLGICGGSAGLVIGIVLARRMSRSIVQLDVSIQGVAGQLHDVLGPITVRRVGGLHELEAGLNEIRDHIATLVERLQQRELEILRTEQLAAVGQLAAGIAHELRNPLMPMKMLVQKALGKQGDGQLGGRSLQIVSEEITRLEEKIQEFLDFARPPTLQKCESNLCEIVQNTCEFLRSRAERQAVRLHVIVPDQPVLVFADGGQLRQVILNLILNALDAQSEGGTIEVELEDQAAGDSQHTVRLLIRDEGPGISDDVLPRLFEPFVSSKETGTGLGLSICRRIVEAHNGQICARRRSEQGTEFVVSLPA